MRYPDKVYLEPGQRKLIQQIKDAGEIPVFLMEEGKVYLKISSVKPTEKEKT